MARPMKACTTEINLRSSRLTRRLKASRSRRSAWDSTSTRASCGRWRGRVADGTLHRAGAVAEVDITNDPSAVAASIDQPTLQAVQEALSARALEEASAAYDRDGVAGARRVLERRKQAVRIEAPQLAPA